MVHTVRGLTRECASNTWQRVPYLSASVMRLPHKEALYQVSLTFTSLRCIECMRRRLLLAMFAVSVRQYVSLSVTLLNSASLCGGHSVQPLLNYFSLLLLLLQF